MSRPDLLALSPDDLAALANRGLVKRAQAELDGGAVEGVPAENAAGTVSVLWSDDAHCLLPSGKPLQEAKCSCSASGICRHIIRSVLAYQRANASAQPPATTEAPTAKPPAETDATIEAAPASAWNPATLTDETLAQIVPAAVIKRAHKLWDDGQLIEVAISARPGARFHTLSANTRFLVRDDARYTHCDCAESAPCVHVPLAVWAFRRLDADAQNGLISTRIAPLDVPRAELEATEQLLGELALVGLASAGGAGRDRLARLEGELRGADLIWPAEIASEIAQQLEWHDAHNARFDAARAAQLVGELLVRADAIAAQTGALPDAFVRGSASDVATPVGAARLIGVGTSAHFYRGGVELRAFLQDGDSGATVFVAQDFPDPTDDPNPNALWLRAAPTPSVPQSLARLGANPRIKGSGIGAIGGGQLLARGGKRAPSGALSFGRAPISVNAGNYRFEELRAPLLAESFAAIAAQLEQQAPAVLRPRRAGENLRVAPVGALENARFAPASQQIRAMLRDAQGASATLIHPYTSRGASGAEATLAMLRSSDDTLLFVAGQWQQGAEGLTVAPLGLVVERAGKRRFIQPWIESATGETTPRGKVEALETDADPLRDWGVSLGELLGETLLLGLHNADELLAREWRSLSERGASLGLNRLALPLARLADELERKNRVREWPADAARAALFETLVMAGFVGG